MLPCILSLSLFLWKSNSVILHTPSFFALYQTLYYPASSLYLSLHLFLSLSHDTVKMYIYIYILIWLSLYLSLSTNKKNIYFHDSLFLSLHLFLSLFLCLHPFLSLSLSLALSLFLSRRNTAYHYQILCHAAFWLFTTTEFHNPTPKNSLAPEINNNWGCVGRHTHLPSLYSILVDFSTQESFTIPCRS